VKKLLSALATAFLFASTIFGKTISDLPRNPRQQSTGLNFIENKGQVHDQNYQSRPGVLYSATAGNMVVHIKNTGVSYQLYRVDKYKEREDPNTKEKSFEIEQQTIYRIDLNWLNYNTRFTKTEDEALPGFNNYYLQNCPSGALHVKSYKGITLNNVYKGINLHYYEKNGELKHDYIVAPHTDYKQIQVQVEGAEISLNEDGSLLLNTPLGKVQEGAPIVYQNAQQLKARWQVKNNTLGFEIEKYNPDYELIIDPVTRLWGTYYGSTGSDYAYSCATDASGSVYMAGETDPSPSTLVATVGSHQSVHGGNTDAYLVKFNPGGSRQWGTYYGGSTDDVGYSCATDPSGNVYLAGHTGSNTGTIIATPGSHQQVSGGNYDAFLVKFSSSGIRQWGTYYGGSQMDMGRSCATDASGNVYLAGYTSSNTGTVIASTGSHQPAPGAINYHDAFLVKFNSNGIRQWGTYYGGTGTELGYSCATDAVGNVCLAGYAQSATGTVIATVGSHQPTQGGGGNAVDAFLVKFNSNGIRQWGTYYGGTGSDYGFSCTADASGNWYMSGASDSNTGTVIATAGSHQSSFAGGTWDSYLVKFNSSGTRQWSTYYGGPGTDSGYSCDTDAMGNVYLAGNTTATTSAVIATAGSHQFTFGGAYDAYVVKFDVNGLRQWGTYYGGTGNDQGVSCAMDASGIIYLAGFTDSSAGTAIATPGGHQGTFGGGSYDAYLVKFDVCELAPAQPLIISGPTIVCAGSVTSYSTPLAFGANSYTWSLPAGWSVSGNSNTISGIPGSSGVFTLIAGNSCGVSPQQTLTITVNATPTVTVNNGTICSGQSFTIVASGANTFTYSAGPVVSPGVTGSYTVTGTNTLGCSNTTVSSVVVNACTDVKENDIAKAGIKLYPNPTKGIVNLELDSEHEVVILNVIGQTVYSSKFSSGTHQINFENLAKGIYIARAGNAANLKSFCLIKE